MPVSVLVRLSPSTPPEMTPEMVSVFCKPNCVGVVMKLLFDATSIVAPPAPIATARVAPRSTALAALENCGCVSSSVALLLMAIVLVATALPN